MIYTKLKVCATWLDSNIPNVYIGEHKMKLKTGEPFPSDEQFHSVSQVRISIACRTIIEQ